MMYYTQKRWRLKFRRDPDAGRVLFIGPLVISFDVVSGRPSTAITEARKAIRDAIRESGQRSRGE